MSRLFGSRGPLKPHLVVGPGGIAKEVYDVRQDVDAAFGVLEAGGFIRTDEFTNPAAANSSYFKASFAGSTSAVVLRASAGDFVQTVAPSGHAREIVITRDNTPNAFSTSPIVVTGYSYGEYKTLTFVQANDDGNDTLLSTERIGLDHIEEVRIPANLLATGHFTIGYAAALGLFGGPSTRAGLMALIREVVDGAVVTTGTVTGRLYTPATAPNGVHDYALTYEVDPAA
jgi:hypothetical protein